MAPTRPCPEDGCMSTTPEDVPESSRPVVKPWLRRGARTVGLILLFFVAWVWVRGMADPYGYLSIDPGVIFAAALVAAGVLLLRGQQPVYEDADTMVVEPKQRSPLGALTLSIAFLVVGLMILLGNLGVADITIGEMAAAGLFVVGIGLLVGVWWGRSRLLIVVGVAMVPIVVAGGFMHFPLRGSLGDRWIDSRSIDNVDLNHEMLLGSLHMNLAGLRSFEGERQLNISMAAGQATIFIPAKIGLKIAGHIEWGNASIGHGRQSGDDLVLANELEGKPDAGHLTINFTGGIASLYVERITYAQLHGPLPGGPDEPRSRPTREALREQRAKERPRELRAERRKERRAEERRDERRRRRRAEASN